MEDITKTIFVCFYGTV